MKKEKGRKSKFKECGKKEYLDFFASLQDQKTVLRIIKEMKKYKESFNLTDNQYIIPA